MAKIILSVFLLFHSLGKPVENAKTTVESNDCTPDNGQYDVIYFNTGQTASPSADGESAPWCINTKQLQVPVATNRLTNSVFVALPFAGNDVLLTSSWLKERKSLNTEFLRQLDPDRLLHNFRGKCRNKIRCKTAGGMGKSSMWIEGTFCRALSFGLRLTYCA